MARNAFSLLAFHHLARWTSWASMPLRCAHFKKQNTSFMRTLAPPLSRYQNLKISLFGDFNARVGSDYTTWSDCLEHFGIGKMNDNGQRLLGVLLLPQVCIITTFFKTKPCHKMSSRHLGPDTGISLTWPPLEELPLTMRSLHAASTARTTTLIVPWCAVTSVYNQRRSTIQSRKGAGV